MSLSLRKIFNIVQQSDPKLLDEPLCLEVDEGIRFYVESINYCWKDQHNEILDDEEKEEAICDAEYPMFYADKLEKVVVLG